MWSLTHGGRAYVSLTHTEESPQSQPCLGTMPSRNGKWERQMQHTP